METDLKNNRDLQDTDRQTGKQKLESSRIVICNRTSLFSFYKDTVYKRRQPGKWPIFKDMVVILLVVISISFPGSDFFYWSL